MTTAPIHGFVDTWNDAGITFSAIKVSITDTASAADSKLIDFEVGGVSQASIGKDGGIICKGLTSSLNIDLQGNRLVMDADNDTYLEASTDDRLDFVVGGTLVARFDPNAVDTFQLDGVGFSPTGAVVGQALGYPNSTTTLEPYTPAGGGDLLAAANETVTGNYNFTGSLQQDGANVYAVGDTVPITDGGTGATTAAAARAALDVPGKATNETIAGDWTFTGALNRISHEIYDLNAYADIAAALTAIGATEAALFIGSNYTLTANTNIPSNVTLLFGTSGKITLSTFSLNLNGCDIESGRHQIFDNSGGGTLGPTSTGDGTGVRPEAFFPEWYGAAGDGATSDTAAFELAFSVMDPGSIMDLRPSTKYHCDTKIDVTSRRALSIMCGASRSADGTENALIELDAASADDTLFNFSDTSAVLFKNVTLKGPGRAVAGSHLVKITDPSGDLDCYFEGCTLTSAETLVRTEGRNVKFLSGTALVDFGTALEAEWPASYTPGANPDQTAENGFRGFEFDGCRIHGAAGGWIMRNVGANAENIRGVHIVGNYIDTSVRIFEGAAREFVFSSNLNTSNNAGATGLFRIYDVNAVGGKPNRGIKINDNIFAGMVDTATPANNHEMIIGADITAATGVDFKDNYWYRIERDAITLSGCDHVSIVGDTYHDVCLDHVNSVAGGNTRAPIRFVTGTTSSNVTIDDIKVIQTGSTPSVIPIVRTTGATVTGLKIGTVQYDAAKWSLTNAAESAYRAFVPGGQILANTGSTSAPGLSFEDDPDTGFRNPAAGDLRAVISGSDKVFFSANGLGVGAAPAYPGDFRGTGGFPVSGTAQAQSQVAYLFRAHNSDSAETTFGVIYCSPSVYTAGSEASRFRIEHRVGGALVNKELCVSDGGTGGTGSAGTGNQYVEMEINGTTYKVLHDGTV